MKNKAIGFISNDYENRGLSIDDFDVITNNECVDLMVKFAQEQVKKFELSCVSKSLFCKDAGKTDCPYERQGGICRSPLDNCHSQFTK